MGRVRLHAILLTLILTAAAGSRACAQPFRIPTREQLDSIANPVAAADSPMRFGQTRMDAGRIGEDDGPYEFVFRWRNCGEEPVVITDVRTGCGCVVARYDKRPVMPGSEGELSLTFHPKGHPGRLMRKVTLFTQSGGAPAAVLELTGSVTPSAVPAHAYRYAFGPLRLKQRGVRMNGGRRAVERIEVLNAGEAPLHLTVDRRLLPDYVTVRFDPETIEAGAVGDIEIGFDPTQLRTALPKRVPVVLEGLALPPSRRTLYLQFEEGND